MGSDDRVLAALERAIEFGRQNNVAVDEARVRKECSISAAK